MASPKGTIKPNKRKAPNEKGEWKCSACGEWKPSTEYNKNKQQTNGLHYSCRSCAKRHVRKYNLPSKYGITLEKYDSLLAAQMSKCSICEKDLVDGSDDYQERPVVDHNHATGEVREILCYGCNLALGNALDSSEYVLKLYDYLKRHGC